MYNTLNMTDPHVVQLVIEIIAAGQPLRMSDDVYTYLETSFRTASYKCSGTVFNPKLEKMVRRPPPPIMPTMSMTFEPTEASGLLQEKQVMFESDTGAGWQRWLCCS